MKRISVIILSISLSFLKCEEPLKLDIVKGTDLLVVDGLITDQPGPYTVILSRTNEFGTQDRSPLENDATVTIWDDSGNSEILEQVSEGAYQTEESGIKGEIGRSYWITITTANGEEYQSVPEPLVAVPAVDSIYAEFIEEPLVEIDGHQFFIDLFDPAEEENYYRWTWESVTPIMTRRPRRAGPLFCCNVCFKTTIDNLGFNVFSDQFINGNKLVRHPIHLAPYRTNEKYLLRVSQYSLSSAAYEFWNNLREQSESVGSIFDTPPAPIVGNVKNLQDSKKNALGFFGASALVKVKLRIDRGRNGEPFRNPQRFVGEGDCRVTFNLPVEPPPDWGN